VLRTGGPGARAMRARFRFAIKQYTGILFIFKVKKLVSLGPHPQPSRQPSPFFLINSHYLEISISLD